MKRFLLAGLVLSVGSVLLAAPAPDAVKTALVKAVTFYHAKAASHGGYVYRYSGDFTLREAEGSPGPDTIWIQPPGTPAIGVAFLDVYEVTGDESCLAAAVDAAHALTRTNSLLAAGSTRAISIPPVAIPSLPARSHRQVDRSRRMRQAARAGGISGGKGKITRRTTPRSTTT